MKRNKIKNSKLPDTFNVIIADIIYTEKFKKIDEYKQHGNTSCFWHSIAVAYYSFKIFEFLNINYNLKSLIKGALLHDYFLYDWHNYDKTHRWHGFKHPKIALKNAINDFEINFIEKDIIEKHMFPLTISPPRYKESVMVCIVDKMCSIYEFFNLNAYIKLKNLK